MHDISEIELQAASVLGPRYDAACRLLFLNREILAPVLKEVVSEYRNCSVQEVIDCIVPESICSSPVDDVSVMAAALPTEMSSVSEKVIRFDTRFRALNPELSGESLRFYLHIDLEVQNSYRPGYPIVKRGVYYAAREISSQLGVLTEESDYGRLEKVYSIWICNRDIPGELKNTVSSYRFTKKDLIGDSDEPVKDFDLMEVIVIRRGNNEGKEDIFDYLTGIFLANINRIQKYVDISGNEEIKREVRAMPMEGTFETVLEMIREDAYIEGEAKGFSAGRSEGFSAGRSEGFSAGRSEGFSAGRSEGFSAGKENGHAEGRREMIRNMLDSGLPFRQVMAIAKIPEGEWGKYRGLK